MESRRGGHRQGAGRPRTGKDPGLPVTVILNQEQSTWVLAQASRGDTSRAAVLRQLVELAMRRG